MKLKYNFVVRTVDGRPIAVAVGEDNAKFSGMIKLNDTGKFIFEMLADDVSENDITEKFLENYDVSADEAASAVGEFLDGLRRNGLLSE